PCSVTDHGLVATNERLAANAKRHFVPSYKKEITFASTHTPAIKPRNGVDTLPSMRISTRSPKFRGPCRLAQNELVWAVLPNYISDSPIKHDLSDPETAPAS